MIKLKKLWNEFRAGDRVLDLIESGTYKLEEGFKHLIPSIKIMKTEWN